MSLTALVSFALLGAPQSQDIRSFIQTDFQDAQFTVRTGQHSIPELIKINRDFAQSYRFRTAQVWLEEPFRMRMVSEVEDSQVIFIINGTRKTYRIPRSSISRTEDVSRAPGKRQTAFDFGILTSAMVNDLFDATFVRMDRATGAAVFDLRFKPSMRDSSRHRVWIDPARKFIIRREWYGQDRVNNRLMATILFDEPKKINDFWMNTRVVVNNADNRRAGTVSYEGIRINQGLDDGLFGTR